MMNHKEKTSVAEDVPACYLGLSHSELDSLSAFHTAKEIAGQPDLWIRTWHLIQQQQASIRNFLNEVYAHDALDIILTGAGTSAFIGNVLLGPFQKNTGKRVWSVASTALVSHPENYLHREHPTLCISFARSGNSPESVAAVNLVNAICKKSYHLIITCNPSGKLVQTSHTQDSYVLLLPPEADDQSLAMTGSFTSMLLAGLLISRIFQIDILKDQVERLSRYGKNIIHNYSAKIKEVATLNFDRAVFLGSGPLQGTAQEAHLKLQELTDGRIICKHDSFLGFRHGPKAVINGSTLLVYLFSNVPYIHQYEMDLVHAINAGEKGLYSIGVLEKQHTAPGLDLVIELTAGLETIEEEFLAVCSVLPAQMLGFFKSLALGLKPDSPSVNGTITRVVQGVTIYPYARQNGKDAN